MWGIEGRHAWIPPAVAAGLTLPSGIAAALANPAVLIFRKTNDAGADIFPRFRLEKIGGLKGTGDSGASTDPKVRAQGEIPRGGFRRGKTISYTGRIEAENRADLRTAETAMEAAFNEQNVEGLMVVYPHPIYDGSGDFRYFKATALTCDIDDSPGSGRLRSRTRGHESLFVVTLRNARAGGVSYRDQDEVTYP